MNRLRNTRCYLAGAMDRVSDGGVGWRRSIGGWLHFHGVEVYDPTDKPIDIGIEDLEARQLRRVWKTEGQFSKLASDMKIIRAVDLRMVDVVDFLIINLDLDVHACGTYEELFLANREKKPCIIRVEQGKANCPDWMFGVLPHQLIFSTWAEVHQYLTVIDEAPRFDSLNRWYFFDHDKTRRKMGKSLTEEYYKLVQQYGPEGEQSKSFLLVHNHCIPFSERAKRIDANWRKLNASRNSHNI